VTGDAVVTGVGEGEAAGDGVGLVADGEIAGLGVPTACPVPDELPHAASTSTTTAGAMSFTTPLTSLIGCTIFPCLLVCSLTKPTAMSRISPFVGAAFRRSSMRSGRATQTARKLKQA